MVQTYINRKFKTLYQNVYKLKFKCFAFTNNFINLKNPEFGNKELVKP